MKKGCGQIIHVSDFIEEENSRLIIRNKEGIMVKDARCITYLGSGGDAWWVSWTESATSSFRSSKLKVPQVSPMIRPARDPEKQGIRAKLSGDLIPHDQSTSKSPDISRVLTHDKSRDQIRFGQARSLLINRWQTVGTVCNQQRHVTPEVG
jgi:hypothetical protein